MRRRWEERDERKERGGKEGERGERKEERGGRRDKNHEHKVGRLVQVTVTIDSPRQSTVVQYNVLLRTMVSGGQG